MERKIRVVARMEPTTDLKKYHSQGIYSLALPWAFFMMGSIFVAFMMLPLILSLPPMNSLCALALPETSEAKSSSDSERVTVEIPRVLAWNRNISSDAVKTGVWY